MAETNARTIARTQSVRTSRREPLQWATLAAISAGGMAGALARYAISTAFPSGAFAWATLLVNVAGCLVIGMLMVAIGEVWRVHRLVRPFLGVGVLGGFTTFSTFIVDIQRAVAAGAARTGLIYLAVTLVGALTAVHLGMRLMRRLTRRREGSRS